MKIKAYYSGTAETDLGDGTIFVEVGDEDYAVRQVGLLDGHWYWAEESNQSDERFFLADQPIYPSDIPECKTVTPEEFEKYWIKAKGVV